MWIILQRLLPRYIGYVTLPVAIVVGSIGCYIEGKYRKEQSIPYLDKGLIDQRISRQLTEERKPEFINYDNLEAEKRRIVPKSSLGLNTGRSSQN